jgi:hypothetical protein
VLGKNWKTRIQTTEMKFPRAVGGFERFKTNERNSTHI